MPTPGSVVLQTYNLLLCINGAAICLVLQLTVQSNPSLGHICCRYLLTTAWHHQNVVMDLVSLCPVSSGLLVLRAVA